MRLPSFDAVAPIYDHLARLVFGKSIARAQTHFLNAIPANANVLVVGGGTGWIIRELLQNRCLNHIDYVEASMRMIHLAQRKYDVIRKQPNMNAQTQVNFIHGTEENLPQKIIYDAIITFFVLDTQSDAPLQKMMSILYGRLKKPGVWLFADFKISRKKHERWWHQLLVSAMFLFFRLTCRLQNNKLPDYDLAFTKLELMKEKEKFFYGNLIISEVYRKC